IAGVRLGYLITSNVEILSEIRAKLPPWNISTMAQEGGVVAIEKCSDLSQMRQIVKIEREYLIENLRKFNFKVFESSTNFILFKCDFDLKTPLKKREILIRDASNFYSFSEFTYRICVKLHGDNVKLIEIIKEIVECQQNQ
ncbi:MAG: aminotransferase class I/II-fold pyridoxal phosphate-dependent enzyme, partial [Clostridia bacterium]